MRNGNEVVHLSRGNNYGEKCTTFCVPSRFQMPRKGHTWTHSLRRVTCPLCLEHKIIQQKSVIASLRRQQRENQSIIETCQKGFRIEVKREIDFKADPEILERIRAGI